MWHVATGCHLMKLLARGFFLERLMCLWSWWWRMQLPNGTVAYRKVCSRSQDWLIQTKQCTSKTSPRFDATSTVAFDLSKKEQCNATNQYWIILIIVLFFHHERVLSEKWLGCVCFGDILAWLRGKGCSISCLRRSELQEKLDDDGYLLEAIMTHESNHNTLHHFTPNPSHILKRTLPPFVEQIERVSEHARTLMLEDNALLWPVKRYLHERHCNKITRGSTWFLYGMDGFHFGSEMLWTRQNAWRAGRSQGVFMCVLARAPVL